MHRLKQIIQRYRFLVGAIVLIIVVSVAAFQLNNRTSYREEIGDTGIVKVGPIRQSAYYEKYAKAAAYLKERRILEASEIYDELIIEEPFSPNPLLGLAACRGLLGNYEGAIVLFNKALTFDPKSSEALFGLGSTYRHLDDYEKAIEYFILTLKIDSNDADAHAGLAYVYSKKREFDKALHHFNLFKKLAPDSNYIDSLEKVVNNAK